MRIGLSSLTDESAITSSSSTEEDDARTPPSKEGKLLYSFIRKRSQGTMHAYGLTTVRVLDNGQQVEVINLYL